MTNKIIDVVNFEMEAIPSRDREVAVLVCNYLRYQGFSVRELPPYDGLYQLTRLQPKVLFFVNPNGGVATHKLMRAASKSGAPIVTLIAEGNVPDSAPDSQVNLFVWGDSTDKILHEDLRLLWSERILKIFLEYEPDLDGRLGVSGGVNFDLPTILSKIGGFERQQFLHKYNLQSYSRVIGVGCWDFGPYYNVKDLRYEVVRKIHSQAAIDRFVRDRDQHEELLFRTAQAFSDVLFIVKVHPSIESKDELHASGVSQICSLPNVLVLKDEEPIIFCIQACDLWLSYESTTMIQAWQLGIQTGLLNPSGTDFRRANVFRGSPNFPSPDSMIQALREFYLTGSLPGFSALESERQKVMKDVFQWNDGLNHVRVGNAIINMIQNETSQTFELKWKYRVIGVLLHVLWLCTGFVAKYRIPFPFNTFLINHIGTWRASSVKKHQELRFKQQTDYYGYMGLSKEDLLKFKHL